MLGRIATVAALAVGGLMLSKRMKSGGMQGMSSAQESMEMDVPVSTAYNQWTQFEEFPRFMAGVEEVRQIDDSHLHWRASVAGKTKEWDAEITHQVPDRRIAWRSTSGVPNQGEAIFQPLSGNRCRVTLRMQYQPEDMIEQVGDAAGAVNLRLRQNLSRFKTMIEERGHETGAWRGSVSGGTARPSTH